MKCKWWPNKYWRFFLSATIFIVSSKVEASLWTLTEISLGGRYSFALDINNSGQVVGEAYLPSGNARAFITGPNGIGIRELGAFDGGLNSRARAINEHGQVVGEAELGGIPHAFLTGDNGVGLIDLGIFGGDFSYATGINDYGQVVVNAVTFGNPLYSPSVSAFFTGSNGEGITPLGHPDETYSFVRGINNFGQIIWETNRGGFISEIDSLGRRELGSLNAQYGNNSNSPYAINDAGQVVGNASPGLPFSTQAFITGPNGAAITGLGTLGGDASYAYDINESGQVVGLSRMSDGSDHAFVTDSNGAGMIDLNSLVTLPDGAYLRYASGINDWGRL